MRLPQLLRWIPRLPVVSRERGVEGRVVSEEQGDGGDVTWWRLACPAVGWIIASLAKTRFRLGRHKQGLETAASPV